MSCIIFVVNDLIYFTSHRLPLAQAARAAGHEVHIAAPSSDLAEKIVSHGFTFHALPLTRSGKNPLNELVVIYHIYRLFKVVKPDLVHLVTIKPVLYGGIAARLARVPSVVAAVSGLGFVFMATDFKSRLIKMLVVVLYRLALGKERLKVIFQNKDDRNALIDAGILTGKKDIIIRGSGVDLTVCHVTPEKEGIPVVVMAARLLKDKGVWEFVEATSELRKRGVRARFVLAGDVDFGNPTSLTAADIESIQQMGHLELTGYCSNIAALFASAHVVVLPSYREGLPKVLIEAAACGRAVVTTDVPGCRDAIESNQTGILVPVRDSKALADAIQTLVEQPDLRQKMAKAGRELSEQEFDIKGVVNQHLSIYNALLDGVENSA